MRILKVCLFILSLLLVVVEVCYGGLNLELMATMTGENEGDALGGVVAGLGDINGDGYDDVAVRTKSKVVYIYWGSVDFDTIPDVILDDHEMDSGFGNSIDCAGDVNGDSISDIIVGASRYNSQAGRAYLYFGGVPFDTIPDLIFEEPVGEYGAFGGRVSCAGDVNHDAFDDVIVSAINEGKVYLYLGGENMDNVADVVFYEGDLFGGSVSSAGDVNGDGYDDIIVGSTHPAYIFWGGSDIDTIPDLILEPIEYGGQIVSAGDLNHDVYSDIIIGGNHRTFFYYGSANPDTLFDLSFDMTGSISTGYFSNDSFCDALIGDWGSYGGLGSAWVLLGGNPMDSIPDWGVVGKYGGLLGRSVSSAGDVNGDSVEDVIIGEPGYFFGSNRGRAYVYAGDPNRVEDCNQPYQVPREFELEQNYPNPFNTETIINYQLSIINPAPTTLKIYNILGEEVATLVNKRQRPGYYSVTWEGDDDNGKRLSSGIYLYQLRCGSYSATRKLLYLK